MIDIERFAKAIFYEDANITYKEAVRKAKRISKGCPVEKNIVEWYEGKKLTDIYVGELTANKLIKSGLSATTAFSILTECRETL